MVSSELAEVVAESDRILVMKNGSLVAELCGSDRTRDQVMKYAL
jgi:ribose transport system ATP-binding protein